MSDEDNGGNWRTKLTDATREIGRRAKAIGERTKSLTRVGSGRRIDATAVLSTLAGLGGSMIRKKRGGLYAFYATFALCAWLLADVTSIYLERFIPEPPISRATRGSLSPSERRTRSLDEYAVIVTRNLFNSDGKIPGEEAVDTGPADLGGAPVQTSLPFNLIGTLILRDELRSIATIEDKSAANVYPVRAEDEIPSKARILSVEPRRVVFVNIATGRREFVALPEELSDKNPRITLGTQPKAAAAGAGIERVSPTQFNVSRAEVDKTLSNLNQVLTQARAVPNFENGMPAGYKLFQIVPGSIYEKLGLQNGDTLVGINGEGINDPSKAFELLNQLKTSSNLELSIKRDGKTSSFAYEIR